MTVSGDWEFDNAIRFGEETLIRVDLSLADRLDCVVDFNDRTVTVWLPDQATAKALFPGQAINRAGPMRVREREVTLRIRSPR